MTAQEIVQALRCCRLGSPCTNCPAAGWGKEDCFDEVHAAAVATIERLTAENAALREKTPQWISVEDRLPTPGTRVLITDGVFVGEGFLSGKIFSVRGERSQWKRYHNAPWKESMKTEITHWMPLPGAPEFADILRGASEAPEEGDKHGTMHNKA